jgi:hypothetical protein
MEIFFPDVRQTSNQNKKLKLQRGYKEHVNMVSSRNANARRTMILFLQKR